MDFVKYPKTQALDRVLPANAMLESLLSDGQYWVVEEKMDGTQLGLQFDTHAQPILQSRGTVITSESEFSWLKSWVWQHHQALYDCLGSRYIAFGEWLWAKHTIYYDQLPHYWLEYDVYDREHDRFLSTQARQHLFSQLPFVHRVRVIDTVTQGCLAKLWQMIGESAFISNAASNALACDQLKHTDTSRLMEGLYLKVENDHQVMARYKLIRPEFIAQIVESGAHWKAQVLFKNKLI